MPKLTKLGKYEIRGELGKGGMGIVYEGFDPFIQRSVALKTVQMSMVDKSEVEEAFSRFRREAQAAGRLSHPRIVSIYEYNEDHDMAFIAMELINGKELKDYFDEKVHFSIEESINILLQLLDALDYSHSNGVIHRDIKPANIFITTNNQVKVADFGIAKIESSHLTQTGSVLGTPSYMSPEQFQGLTVDRRSDLYSAGVILYQLLTGKRPFTGSMITIMHKSLNQNPVPPSELNHKVTKALDEVVLHAMAKRPDDRFQSANEFIAALKLAKQSLPSLLVESVDPDATLIVSPHREEINEPTLVLPARDTQTDADKTLVLPSTSVTQQAMLLPDVEFWKNIRDSQNAEDFRQYLNHYPHGEFAELAELRRAALNRAAIQMLKEEELRKWDAEKQVEREKELSKQAEDERKRKLEAEAERLRQKQEAEARAKTIANMMRRKEAEDHARREARAAAIKAHMNAIKAEAAEERKRQEAKRKLEAEEQARHAQHLAGLMAERTKKISEIVRNREAEAEAKRKLEAENRQKLESRAKRRQASLKTK